MPETGTITTRVDYEDREQRPIFGPKVCTVSMGTEVADVETMAASAVWAIGKDRDRGDTYYGPVRVEQAGPAVFVDGQTVIVFREVLPEPTP